MRSVFLAASGGLLTVAACYSAGRLLVGSRRLPASLRFGLGAIVVSFLVFGLLCAGVAYSWLLAPALLGIALPLVRVRPGRFPALPKGFANRLLLGVGAVYGVYYLIQALAPEIQPDAAGYHLGLVREWMLFDRFPRRVGFYEMLPQGLEMLFLPAYAIGRTAAAKLVHFAFLAATVPLLFATGRRLGLGTVACGAAAALYACTPVVGIAGTSAYTDAALVYFVLAAFYLLLAAWPEETAALPLLGGLAAGFCYAIKMPGLLVPAAGVAALLIGRRWRSSLWFAAGAAAAVAPWMIRSAVATGNPLAPLGNSLFVNRFFHIVTEHHLSAVLESYGDLSPVQKLLELTVHGQGLQGLVGPVFLLAPLALVGLRTRTGRLLLLVAGVLSVPWFLNQGARFLMPSLLFVALALAASLPRKLVVALAVVQAVLGLPPVMDQYARTDAWRLHGLPWRVALGIEPTGEYLDRTLWEHRLARLVQDHVPAGAQVFDLFGAPSAYFDAAVIGPWHSAAADEMREALGVAVLVRGGVLSEVAASWREQPLAAVRIRLAEPGAPDWSLQEVRLRDRTGTLAKESGWRLAAWPNIWEAPLALDGNLATRWAAWEPARRDMYFQVNLPAARPITGATLVIPSGERRHHVEFIGRTADGRWVVLEGSPGIRPLGAINLRRSATQVLRQEGVGYILAPVSDSPFAAIGQSLVSAPAEWGVEVLGHERGVYLLALAAPAAD